MFALFNRLTKPLIFGLFAAFGCLIGAMLGELFLDATTLPPPPPPPAHAVSMLIDTSSSMTGTKLQEVKSAAKQFVQRRNESNLSNLSRDRIAVVGFDSTPYVAAPLTDNLGTLEQSIDALTAKGSTAMDRGLQAAVDELRTATVSDRSILVFTDGQPDNSQLALDAGQSAKSQGIRIVAVATNDADMKLLGQITGDQSLVFLASVGSFEQAFQKAEKAIYERDIVTRDATPVSKSSPTYSLLRIGGWTAFLALGTGLALIIGQNRYLHRRLLTVREGLFGTIGGLVVGFASGVAGQLLYTAVPSLSALEVIGRIMAWTILGSLLGGGMAFFVPNLKLNRALLGGGLGGTVGVFGFLLVSITFGNTVARLLGAAILGFFIGLAIALVEELAREAWLVVHWGPREESTIALGAQPVVLGSSDKAHIYIQGSAPEAATICLTGGKIQYEDKKTKQKTILKNDSKLQITGSLWIEVKSLSK